MYTLGIQDMNSNYIIKLPSWTQTTESSGMKITYVRRNNTYRDEIIIPGLVTEDLKLVVWKIFMMFNNHFIYETEIISKKLIGPISVYNNNAYICLFS